MKSLISRALFAGYGFVMVQDVGRYWDQIKACPGVRGVMMMTLDAGSIVPATIDDGLVRYIQVVENAEDGWIAGSLQDQQDELDAAWRREVSKPRNRTRVRPPAPVLEVV